MYLQVRCGRICMNTEKVTIIPYIPSSKYNNTTIKKSATCDFVMVFKTRYLMQF